jgi:hypothetical protein
MDIEIDVDDIRSIPISREGWPDDAPGEYIVAAKQGPTA